MSLYDRLCSFLDIRAADIGKNGIAIYSNPMKTLQYEEMKEISTDDLSSSLQLLCCSLADDEPALILTL